MTTEIRVPQLPESVADATLVAWHKQPGEAIKRDENLADLETDKVVLEVPAPANGVVREIKIQSGTVVTSGQLLAIIEEGATAGPQDLRRPHLPRRRVRPRPRSRALLREQALQRALRGAPHSRPEAAAVTAKPTRRRRKPQASSAPPCAGSWRKTNSIPAPFRLRVKMAA